MKILLFVTRYHGYRKKALFLKCVGILLFSIRISVHHGPPDTLQLGCMNTTTNFQVKLAYLGEPSDSQVWIFFPINWPSRKPSEGFTFSVGVDEKTQQLVHYLRSDIGMPKFTEPLDVSLLRNTRSSVWLISHSLVCIHLNSVSGVIAASCTPDPLSKIQWM